MEEDDDEKVGYRRPPKHSRFKKGQSGNPRGRRPKSRSFDAMMRKELSETLTMKVGGTVLRATKLEAIAKTIVADALKGNTRSQLVLFRYLREISPPEPFAMTDADNEDLEAALKSLLHARQKRQSDTE